MDDAYGSVGAWAKSYYFAVRATMESILRPYGLGSTQYYVLYQLTNAGPTMQRDLGRMLQIERATLSGIVSTLLRKGLIDQMPGPEDQRQRVLRLTDAGMKLWEELPDPLAVIRAIAFEGSDAAELATAVRVLQAGTQRLSDHMSEGGSIARHTAGLGPPSTETLLSALRVDEGCPQAPTADIQSCSARLMAATRSTPGGDHPDPLLALALAQGLDPLAWKTSRAHPERRGWICP
jgi:DNA-binding MarR family transcriptional regulator